MFLQLLTEKSVCLSHTEEREEINYMERKRSGSQDSYYSNTGRGSYQNGYAQGRRSSGRGAAGSSASARSGQRRSSGTYGASGNGSRRSSGSYNTSGNGQRGASGRKGRNTAKRKKKSRFKFLLCLIIFLILIAACGIGGMFLYKNIGQGSAPDIQVDLESLDSPYAVMIDSATGTVIGSKRGDEVIYPASMTKILTVLTAIEHIDDLDKTIQMSYDYYDALYAADASRAGFEPGEDAVIRDLLYGALLPSGAECCMELAVQAAGSESAFADLMNQKVQELGLRQSHFTNCTGLHDDQQYSTTYEIGLILQAALKNKTFREVFTTHSYTVGATNVHPDGFTFQSSMFKNMQSPTVINGEIKGGKTGFTQAAGYCLASMAEIGGREYIQVTAGWAENPRTSQYHVNDAFLGYNMVGRAIEE